jgi:hypothetical protein
MAFKNTTYFTSFNAKGCDIKEGLITIPNKVEKCTKELLVYYTCDSVQKMGCADKNMLIGACSIIECQSTIRSIIDNEYINVRAVDDVVLVDIKPFNWQRVLNFLNEFVNDANDFVYISVLLALILILIFFSKDVISSKLLFRCKVRSPPPIPSGPKPKPSAPPLPLNFYEQSYGVYNETTKNITKEIAPYSGVICRACQFKSKNNAGLNTHVKAMLVRKKTTHSKFYK